MSIFGFALLRVFGFATLPFMRVLSTCGVSRAVRVDFTNASNCSSLICVTRVPNNTDRGQESPDVGGVSEFMSIVVVCNVVFAEVISEFVDDET